MAHVHTQPAADASTPMLRLQMYLPHARRRGVHNALPALPEFNWFFFGKKLFDETSGHYFLQLDFPVQFLEVDTGQTYRLPPKIVGRFLIATSEKSNGEWETVASRLRRYSLLPKTVERFPEKSNSERDDSIPPWRYDGFVRHRTVIPSHDRMKPPFPREVEFFIRPSSVEQVDDWRYIRLFRYAAEEPQWSSQDIKQQISHHGSNAVAKDIYACLF